MVARFLRARHIHETDAERGQALLGCAFGSLQEHALIGLVWFRTIDVARSDTMIRDRAIVSRLPARPHPGESVPDGASDAILATVPTFLKAKRPI